MLYIYDSDYDEMPEDPFDSINDAAMYIMADLPHEDYLYMIGTDDGIEAVVFQGQVYSPKASLAGIHARAEAAEAEIETVHVYLDECYINDTDEGRAVPLIDRIVLLVSFLARDHEVDALARRSEAAEAEVADRDKTIAYLNAQFSAAGRARDAAEAEVARLRAQLAEAQEEVEHWRVNYETLLAMKATLEATP